MEGEEIFEDVQLTHQVQKNEELNNYELEANYIIDFLIKGIIGSYEVSDNL